MEERTGARCGLALRKREGYRGAFAGFQPELVARCHALMQAAGLVDDHVVSCFRRAEVARGL